MLHFLIFFFSCFAYFILLNFMVPDKRNSAWSVLLREQTTMCISHMFSNQAVKFPIDVIYVLQYDNKLNYSES